MEGEQPYLGDFVTMVINHLLTGMILQVGGPLLGSGTHTEPHFWGAPGNSLEIWIKMFQEIWRLQDITDITDPKNKNLVVSNNSTNLGAHGPLGFGPMAHFWWRCETHNVSYIGLYSPTMEILAHLLRITLWMWLDTPIITFYQSSNLISGQSSRLERLNLLLRCFRSTMLALQGTNMSPTKALLKMIFPKVGCDPPHGPMASIARLTVLTVPYMADLLEPRAAANGTLWRCLVDEF